MAIMRERAIREVLTEDEHFIQVRMGFSKVPLAPRWLIRTSWEEAQMGEVPRFTGSPILGLSEHCMNLEP